MSFVWPPEDLDMKNKVVVSKLSKFFNEMKMISPRIKSNAIKTFRGKPLFDNKIRIQQTELCLKTYNNNKTCFPTKVLEFLLGLLQVFHEEKKKIHLHEHQLGHYLKQKYFMNHPSSRWNLGEELFNYEMTRIYLNNKKEKKQQSVKSVRTFKTQFPLFGNTKQKLKDDLLSVYKYITDQKYIPNFFETYEHVNDLLKRYLSPIRSTEINSHMQHEEIRDVLNSMITKKTKHELKIGFTAPTETIDFQFINDNELIHIFIISTMDESHWVTLVLHRTDMSYALDAYFFDSLRDKKTLKGDITKTKNGDIKFIFDMVKNKKLQHLDYDHIKVTRQKINPNIVTIKGIDTSAIKYQSGNQECGTYALWLVEKIVEVGASGFLDFWKSLTTKTRKTIKIFKEQLKTEGIQTCRRNFLRMDTVIEIKKRPLELTSDFTLSASDYQVSNFSLTYRSFFKFIMWKDSIIFGILGSIKLDNPNRVQYIMVSRDISKDDTNLNLIVAEGLSISGGLFHSISDATKYREVLLGNGKTQKINDFLVPELQEFLRQAIVSKNKNKIPELSKQEYENIKKTTHQENNPESKIHEIDINDIKDIDIDQTSHLLYTLKLEKSLPGLSNDLTGFPCFIKNDNKNPKMCYFQSIYYNKVLKTKGDGIPVFMTDIRAKVNVLGVPVNVYINSQVFGTAMMQTNENDKTPILNSKYIQIIQ